MTLVEAFRVAFGGLGANRLRSALTMLGILIGVGAVILLVAVGNGASAQVASQIQGLGSNAVYVYPAPHRPQGGVSQGFASGQTLTMQDVRALNDAGQAPDIAAAIPIVHGSGVLVYGRQNWPAQVTGSSQDFPQVRDYALSAGSMFTDGQVGSSARVVVLGQTAVDNLFNGDPQAALNQTVKIQGQPFRVIGVLAAKGSAGLGNQDNFVVVPYTAAWDYLAGGRGRGSVSEIVLQARSAGAVQAAKNQATEILLARHKIYDPSLADFQILSQEDLLATFNQVSGTLTILLGSIAAISLVVGGIGIMNIMLVTVSERTREIGIRKAIGARRRDILLQFLVESMFLSGAGGVLGIVAGGGLSFWLGQSHLQVGGNGLPPPVVSPPSVVLAFAVSVAIGLFFGIYPANRAASLNPIDALRYE